MALPDDYITDALAAINARPRGRPRQSVLRRAVSTAYYALFLELTEDAGRALAPASPTTLQAAVRRKLSHKPMATACGQWKQGNSAWLPLIGAAVPAQLNRVAGDFVDLQQARHEADYDPSARLSKPGTLATVLRSREAIRAWRALKAADADTANVFLVSLMHPKPKD